MHYAIIAFAALLSTPTAQLDEIRQQYYATQEIRDSLVEIPMQLNLRASEGVSANAFTDTEGRLRLVEVNFYGHSGAYEYNFYYEDNQLYFALKTAREFNSLSYIDAELAEELGIEEYDPDKTREFEYRYYIKNNEIITSITAEPYTNFYGQEIQPEPEETLNLGQDVLEHYKANHSPTN